MPISVRTAFRDRGDGLAAPALPPPRGHAGRSDNSRLTGAEEINGFLADALHRLGRGLFVVTSSAVVLFANGLAETLLGNGLHLHQRQLAAQDRTQSEALRHLILGAARRQTGGGLIVSQQDAAPLLLTVIPVCGGARSADDDRPAAMIVTKDLNLTCRRLDALTRYYGLTPAETRVAQELLVGDGIAGVARRLNISEATARTHRIRVFQKTGTGRQAQLVRLLLEWSDRALNGV